MNVLQDLEKAMLERPRDGTLRLVYCDYAEEANCGEPTELTKALRSDRGERIVMLWQQFAGFVTLEDAKNFDWQAAAIMEAHKTFQKNLKSGVLPLMAQPPSYGANNLPISPLRAWFREGSELAVQGVKLLGQFAGLLVKTTS